MRVDFFNFTSRNDIEYRNDPVSRQKSMLFLIRKMSELVKGIESKQLIVYFPDLFMRDYVPPPPPELPGVLREDVLFLDLTNAVIDYYNNPDHPMLTFGKDTHPNKFAHELFAKEIIKFLGGRICLSMEV